MENVEILLTILRQLLFFPFSVFVKRLNSVFIAFWLLIKSFSLFSTKIYKYVRLFIQQKIIRTAPVAVKQTL